MAVQSKDPGNKRLRLVPFDRLRISATATVVNLVTAVFLVGCANGSFWRALAVALESSTSSRGVFLMATGLILVLVFNTLLSLLSHPAVHKTFLAVVIVLASISDYFMGSYGIVMDQRMITNLGETNFQEAAEFFTWALFRHVFLLGVLPAILGVLVRIRYRPLRRELLVRTGVVTANLVLLAVLLLANFKELVLFGRNHRALRTYVNPTYPIYSFVKVLRANRAARGIPSLRVIASDATRPATATRTAVVYVIGESARAENFSLNGYDRMTNPELGRRGVISFTDVQSCGTDTATALPGMFSHLGKRHYSAREAKKYENLLDVLQRMGVQVIWRDNNSGSKGIADRVRYEDLNCAHDEALRSGGGCYDEILLQGLDQLLRDNIGDLLIVLHQQGSHGPSYYKRTPKAFKPFLPECGRDDVQECERQTIINAYDNTIVYTDYLLARLIDLLETQAYPTAMLYVSDHGESLGEYNVYLHGLPPAIAPSQQTHIPMIFWASQDFLESKAIDPVLLAASLANPYSHENLFHSFLGLFNVQTALYEPSLDLFFLARKRNSILGANRGRWRPRSQAWSDSADWPTEKKLAGKELDRSQTLSTLKPNGIRSKSSSP